MIGSTLKAMLAAFLSVLTAMPAFAQVSGSVSVETHEGTMSVQFGNDGGGNAATSYEGGHGEAHGHNHDHGRLDIPAGHMPPPGMCRIWYYDREPGHQPPPDNCKKLRKIPAGATLIRG